jgi:hypothetical protein
MDMAVVNILRLLRFDVPPDGLAALMSVIILVGDPEDRCMADKDVDIGKPAEFGGGAEVIPLLRS